MVEVEIPILQLPDSTSTHAQSHHQDWTHALRGRSLLDLPDERTRFLFDAAVHTLILCTPDDSHD